MLKPVVTKRALPLVTAFFGTDSHLLNSPKGRRALSKKYDLGV